MTRQTAHGIFRSTTLDRQQGRRVVMKQTCVVKAHSVPNVERAAHLVGMGPMNSAFTGIRRPHSISPAGRSPAFSPTSHKKRTGYGLLLGMAHPDGPIRTSVQAQTLHRIVPISSRPSSSGNAHTSQAHRPHSLKHLESESGPSLLQKKSRGSKGPSCL